jgi:hypothetical protein
MTLWHRVNLSPRPNVTFAIFNLLSRGWMSLPMSPFAILNPKALSSYYILPKLTLPMGEKLPDNIRPGNICWFLQKNWSQHCFFEKMPILSPKIGNNCRKHNIYPIC